MSRTVTLAPPPVSCFCAWESILILGWGALFWYSSRGLGWGSSGAACALRSVPPGGWAELSPFTMAGSELKH